MMLPMCWELGRHFAPVTLHGKAVVGVGATFSVD